MASPPPSGSNVPGTRRNGDPPPPAGFRPTRAAGGPAGQPSLAEAAARQAQTEAGDPEMGHPEPPGRAHGSPGPRPAGDQAPPPSITYDNALRLAHSTLAALQQKLSTASSITAPDLSALHSAVNAMLSERRRLPPRLPVGAPAGEGPAPPAPAPAPAPRSSLSTPSTRAPGMAPGALRPYLSEHTRLQLPSAGARPPPGAAAAGQAGGPGAGPALLQRALQELGRHLGSGVEVQPDVHAVLTGLLTALLQQGGHASTRQSRELTDALAAVVAALPQMGGAPGGEGGAGTRWVVAEVHMRSTCIHYGKILPALIAVEPARPLSPLATGTAVALNPPIPLHCLSSPPARTPGGPLEEAEADTSGSPLNKLSSTA
ncbi:hypothetical protein ACKKBF_B16400 [Auxenochlorella protothecoides x Auxenochlorella symbiontica]